MPDEVKDLDVRSRITHIPLRIRVSKLNPDGETINGLDGHRRTDRMGFDGLRGFNRCSSYGRTFAIE